MIKLKDNKYDAKCIYYKNHNLCNPDKKTNFGFPILYQTYFRYIIGNMQQEKHGYAWICTHISYRSYLALLKVRHIQVIYCQELFRFMLLSVDPSGGVSAGLRVFLPVSQ